MQHHEYLNSIVCNFNGVSYSNVFCQQLSLGRSLKTAFSSSSFSSSEVSLWFSSSSEPGSSDLHPLSKDLQISASANTNYNRKHNGKC